MVLTQTLTDQRIQQPVNTGSRFIRRPEVLGKLGVSKTTLQEMIKEGVFPEPITIHKRNAAWLSDEVDEWIRKRYQQARNPNRREYL